MLKLTPLEQKEMLIFATRYAIQRNSMAVAVMIDILKKNWENLNEYDKTQLITDIVFELKTSKVTDRITANAWRQFLQWAGTTKEPA